MTWLKSSLAALILAVGTLPAFDADAADKLKIGSEGA